MQTGENTRIIDHYHEAGFKAVRLSADAKKAMDEGWQLNDVPLEDLKRHLKQGGNIGLQTGEVSDWLAFVDCDSPEAVALAPKFLPETLTADRNGQVRHYCYRSPGLGYQTFRGDASEELLAIKASANGAGHYLVVEPSNQPEEGQDRLARGFNPAGNRGVPAPELKKRAELLAVSALIARH